MLLLGNSVPFPLQHPSGFIGMRPRDELQLLSEGNGADEWQQQWEPCPSVPSRVAEGPGSSSSLEGKLPVTIPRAGGHCPRGGQPWADPSALGGLARRCLEAKLSQRTWYSVNAATWLNVGHCRRVQPLEQTSLNCPLIGVAESTIAEISEGGGINNPHSVSAALAPLLFPSLCLNLAHYYYFIKGPFLHPLPLEDTP